MSGIPLVVGSLRFLLLPLREVHRAGKRREHDELSEGHTAPLRQVRRRIERVGPVSRQSEDKRPQDVYALLAKRAQPGDECLSRVVEVLVDRLQPFGCDRLDADQRAADPCPSHRREELRILGGFHRDLREEHHIVRQLLELGHQLESLLPQRHQCHGACLVNAALGGRQIGEGYRIEVVVGQGG